jgi:DNA-directed RNA polymerase specialized sigma24 family protein
MEEKEELLDRISGGDPIAEAALYELFQTRLLRVSRHFFGEQDEEALEIVGDTFQEAFIHLGNRAFGELMFSRLRQICLGRCYGRLNERARTLAKLEDALEASLRRLAPGGGSALGALSPSLARQCVRERLLSPEKGRIVELKDLEGMPLARICRTLKLPLGAVLLRLTGARNDQRRLAEDLTFRFKML